MVTRRQGWHSGFISQNGATAKLRTRINGQHSDVFAALDQFTAQVLD
jgi:hypothetical protein